MSLSKDQITNLLGMVHSAEADELDCDGCFGQIAEFADLHLSGQEIPAALRVVETHLQQCACCKDEYNALLKGLRAIDEGDGSEEG